MKAFKTALLFSWIIGVCSAVVASSKPSDRLRDLIETDGPGENRIVAFALDTDSGKLQLQYIRS